MLDAIVNAARVPAPGRSPADRTTAGSRAMASEANVADNRHCASLIRLGSGPTSR